MVTFIYIIKFDVSYIISYLQQKNKKKKNKKKNNNNKQNIKIHFNFI